MFPVERTAFWTAACRADESRRASPLIVDPLAERLCGAEGMAVGRELEAKGHAHDGIVVRTRIFDDRLRDAVGTSEIGVVLSLGCGLDARPYRLSFARPLRFVEVDHAAIVAWKEERLRDVALPPAVTVDRRSFDLGDLDALQRLLDEVHEPLLVVLEGVLQYLEFARAHALLSRLAARPSTRVVADFGGGQLASDRVPQTVADLGAPYRTLVAKPSALLRTLGFSVIADVSLVDWDAAQPSPRWHVPWTRRWLSSVRDVSRVVDFVSAATPR